MNKIARKICYNLKKIPCFFHHPKYYTKTYYDEKYYIPEAFTNTFILTNNKLPLTLTQNTDFKDEKSFILFSPNDSTLKNFSKYFSNDITIVGTFEEPYIKVENKNNNQLILEIGTISPNILTNCIKEKNIGLIEIFFEDYLKFDNTFYFNCRLFPSLTSENDFYFTERT